MLALENHLKNCIEEGNVELPVLPAVGMEVMSLAQSEDSNASQLAGLIQNDMSLASNVMRMANSAAYNSGGSLQTLQQAIARLGMRQVAQMALAISVGENVFVANSATQQLVEYLWRHSVASAAWAKEIARICRSNTEVAFLCGLLSQIGKPIAVNTVTQLFESEEEALQSHQQLLLAIEKYERIIGTSAARRWQLPEAVVESINYIDEYFAAPSARQEVMIVNAANLLASLTLDGKSEEEILLIVAEKKIFHELNFYEDDLHELVGKHDKVQALMNSLTL